MSITAVTNVPFLDEIEKVISDYECEDFNQGECAMRILEVLNDFFMNADGRPAELTSGVIMLDNATKVIRKAADNLSV